MRRRRMALVAAILALAAVGLEHATNLCAMASFDPFGDWTYLAAYLFVPVSLVYSERALAGLAEGEQAASRRAATALIGGICAAAIALTACVMLAPLAGLALRFVPLGAGLAWFSPYVALAVLIAQLAALSREMPARMAASAWIGGLLCAAALGTAVIGRQAAAGYLIGQAMRQGGQAEAAIERLRALRAGHYLLPLMHGYSLPYWVAVGRGRWSDLIAPSNQSWRHWSRPLDAERQAAGELYFRVTGQTAEAAPLPDLVQHASGRGSIRSIPYIEQIGGGEVGRPSPALSLVGSRMTGRIVLEAEMVELRWVLVLRNFGGTPEEARTEIDLPEGTLITGAGLWTAGRERRALFAPWGGARQALPAGGSEPGHLLLVTQPSPDKAFLQCYPLGPGGFARISLNVAVPLRWRDSGGICLEFVPPRFRRANFELAPSARHEVSLVGRWSRAECTIREGAWTGRAGVRARRGFVGGRLAITQLPVAPDAAVEPLRLDVARRPRQGEALPGGLVRLRDPLAPLPAPVSLALVVEPAPSVVLEARELIEDLRGALARLHPDSSVALLRSDLPRQALAEGRAGKPEPLLAAFMQSLTEPAMGGVDPLPALQRAFGIAAGAERPGAVVWLHGPIPHGVSRPMVVAGMLRAARAPALVGVLCGSGPDGFLDELAGEPLAAARWRAPGDRHTLEDALMQAGLLTLERDETADQMLAGGRRGSLEGALLTQAGEHAPDEYPRRSRALALHAWFAAGGDLKQPSLANAARAAAAGQVLTPLTAAVVPEREGESELFQLAKVQRHGITPEPGPAAAGAALLLACLVAWSRRRWPPPAGRCRAALSRVTSAAGQDTDTRSDVHSSLGDT